MSDIDDELLALAGGGDMSSDEGSVQKRGQSHSPRQVSKQNPAKGVATKKTPVKKTSKPAVQADSADEQEEGEASDADSLDSAPMEESDSEDENDDVDDDSPDGKSHDDDNKYPVDGLFITLAEKEEIMSMREVEREQIIAERIQEKERAQQNRLLRQLVTNQQDEEKKHKKRKASTAELDTAGGDQQRRTSRVRTKVGGNKVGETNSAFDSLRRARQEREERTRRRDLDRERGGRDERSPSADSFRSRGSDVSWGSPRRRTRSPPEIKEAPLADLIDLNRIRLSRTRFAEVCFHPHFEELVPGCYVRINIGPDPNTRDNVYRVALIKGFSKGKPYAMQNGQGRDMVTDQYVRAAHGKSQREWPFISCSESPFTEAEWERYKSVLRNEGLSIPKRTALQQKINDINKLIEHVWTQQEIAESVDRKTQLKMMFDGSLVAALERQIQVARTTGADAHADELQQRLDKVQAETPRLAFRTSMARSKNNSSNTNTSDGTPAQSQQERLAQVNAENRRKNLEAVRRAQIKERQRTRDIEARLERGEEVEEDMSRRLRTRAKFVHDVNEQFEKKSGTATPNGGSKAGSEANTPRFGPSTGQLPPHLAKLQQRSVDKNSIPTIHRPLMDDDIIGALDLDIDMDIE